MGILGPKVFKMQGGAKVVIVGRDKKDPTGETVKVKVVDTPYGNLISAQHGGIGAILKVEKAGSEQAIQE